MREHQGPGACFPQRGSLVSKAGGVAAREASAQTRRAGTSSQQRAAPANQQHSQQPIQEDKEIVDEEEGDYNDVWPTRLPTSARRYQPLPSAQPIVIQQGNRQYILHPEPPPQRVSRQAPGQYRQRQGVVAYETEEPARPRRPWLLFLGVGMLAMLALWMVGSVLLSWWQVTQDDWHYGRPRTFQTDAVVGHNDSAASPSHFIAINLNRHVEVIECPGGDCSHAVIYLGPTLFGDGEDFMPVTLTFQDVNGDGKPDMVIHIQDQRIVFINENGKFRPAKPGEVKGIS
jgi:hypothetical protein